MLKGTEFICCLDEGQQKQIEDAIRKVPGADIEEAMSGRLCDLEDNIDWREILK